MKKLLVYFLFAVMFFCGSVRADDSVFSKMKLPTFEEWGKKHEVAASKTVPLFAELNEPENKIKSLQEKANVSFVIVLDDFRHIPDSAHVIEKLIGLFKENNVQANFYVSANIIHHFQNKRPSVISQLKESGMPVNYHIVAPHPVVPGFDKKLKELSDQELEKALMAYESFELDQKTGELDKTKPGGYAYLKTVFEKLPMVVESPALDSRIRRVHLKVLSKMGAKMAYTFDEGTSLNQPFQFYENMLIRPCDFMIARWKMKDTPSSANWWDMLDKPFKDQYIPVKHFKKRISEWKGARAPFVTVKIQGSDFYRRLATPWAYIYYKDRLMQQAKEPPFSIYAPDASTRRAEDNQKEIWQAYKELVEYVAKNHVVMGGGDMVRMGQGSL